MNTTLMLFAQFERPLVPLAEISKDYLGLSPAEANRKANAGTLGVPVVRLRESQNSPWLVHVEDLARMVDKLRRGS